jgi:16S rRNA G527 N7-methylase RsmG
MEPENREILLRGAETFGIDLAEGAILAFDIYLRELVKWNQKINLTAIRTAKGVVIKHFLTPFLFALTFRVTPRPRCRIGAGFQGFL